ncbi:MAG TPA: hypothetical protein VF677_09610 [Flavobacterium sp.]|jgi:hypothetical protein
MKKIIYMSIFSSLLSFDECNNNNERIYSNTPEFIVIEKKMSFKKEDANKIYSEYLTKIFSKEDLIQIESNFWRVIYICKGNYYISYIHKLDKKGSQNGTMHYKAKINSNTGEISIVK